MTTASPKSPNNTEPSTAMKYQRGGLSESSTTSDNTSQFIDIVKKYDVVYNTHHPDYKNVDVKLKVWSQIATEIGLSVDASKRKWKNLRDSYTKYLRSFRVGTKTSKKYQYWAHAEHMEFLKPFQGPGRSNTATVTTITTAATILRGVDEDENECDLGYQVLAKAITNNPEDDIKIQPPILANVINASNGAICTESANNQPTNSSNSNQNKSTTGGGNISAASSSSIALTIPLISGTNTSSVACITPHLPQIAMPNSGGGGNSTSTITTMAGGSGGIILPVPSLPTVQLPPSLIAMPIIGAISNNNNNNSSAYTTNATSTANSLAVNHHLLGGNLSTTFANKMMAAATTITTTSVSGIPMSSSTATNSVGCLIIEPQLFASTDNFKKELTNSNNQNSVGNSNTNNTFITAGALNQFAQQLHETNSTTTAVAVSTTTTSTRFNPTLITKIRRVQPSPQTSAINLSFSTFSNTLSNVSGTNYTNSNSSTSSSNNNNNSNNNTNTIDLNYYRTAAAAAAALATAATGATTPHVNASNGNNNNNIDIKYYRTAAATAFAAAANGTTATTSTPNHQGNNIIQPNANASMNISIIPTTPSPAKIRRTYDPDVTAILQANRDLDANTLFFLSLGKQVRAMPTKFQSLAKMRCMRIISDLELELDNVANGDGITTSYTYNNGTAKYCNLDSPTDNIPQQQHQQQQHQQLFPLSSLQNNNNNSVLINDGQQPEHFVYVMSPSRVEGMIDLSSDEENNVNGN